MLWLPHESVALITIVLVPPKPITLDPGWFGANCSNLKPEQSVPLTKLLKSGIGTVQLAPAPTFNVCVGTVANTGPVVSVIVITCVNIADTLPQLSVAVNVLVLVPLELQVVPAT